MESPVYFTQHRDIVAGPKHFEGLSPDVLFVRSQFATIQGEGPLAGQYAYFIRLGGCNYADKSNHCQFCDTDFRISESSNAKFDELRAAWESAGCHIVVLTGGEPTLQRNIIGLVRANPSVLFQIESNGTQVGVIEELLDLPNCLVVVSPKWSKTGKTIMPSDKMLACVTFKFLISADPREFDYALPGWAHCLKQPFYLSPIAVYRQQYEGEIVSAWDGGAINHELTAKNYAEAAARVISLCSQLGCPARLSIQQHIFTSIP